MRHNLKVMVPNCIFDLDLLSEVKQGFVRCNACDRDDCTQLKFIEDGRHGLAVMIQLECTLCKSKTLFRKGSLTKGFNPPTPPPPLYHHSTSHPVSGPLSKQILLAYFKSTCQVH